MKEQRLIYDAVFLDGLQKCKTPPVIGTASNRKTKRETTYDRFKRENINLKCERDELRESLKEEIKTSNFLFFSSVIIIIGLTISLFIF